MARIVGSAAAGLGHLLRFILVRLPLLPLLLGCWAVVHGVSLLSEAAAWITLGILSILMYFTILRPDRRQT